MEMIDDYAYAETDLWGDPNMLLPHGELWNMDLGKFQKILYFKFL